MISKEEAIHILEIELKAERFVRKCFDEDQNSKVAEALEMSITALKFNPQAAREAIDEIINTAQSQPERPKGRWVCVRPGWYKCSCCGRELQSYSGMDTAKYYPYCHCGAKMQDVGYSETNKYHSICESLEKNGSADMRGVEE